MVNNEITHSSLDILVMAIRTCWDSCNKSDNLGPKDIELIRRVCLKHKHGSVMEHIKIFIPKYYLPEYERIIYKNSNYNYQNDDYIISNLRFVVENSKVLPHTVEALKKKPLGKIFFTDIDANEIKLHKNNYNIKDRVNLLTAWKHNEEVLYYTFKIKGISRALLQELVRHDDDSAFSVKSTRYTLKELKREDKFSIDNEDSFIRANRYVVFTDVDEINLEIMNSLERLRVNLLKGYSNDKVKYMLPEAYKTELMWTVSSKTLDNFLKLRDSKEALWEIADLAKEIKKKIDI